MRREPVEPRRKIRVLGCLHQAEMAFGQHERLVARHSAENRHAQCGDGIGHEPAMPLAADTVQHDAGDPHIWIVRGEAPHQSRRRLRLTGDIDHQQHRQAKARGEVCRGAGASRRGFDPVDRGP